MEPPAIELRLLRYFVAVAETEHVGRAAKRLHISQSPLSRQIRQLEEATSLMLFEREKQRLRLTNDGRWLLERARRLLSQVQVLERDAGRLSRGESGVLRIGFVTTAMWSKILPDALREFRARFAGVTIELKGARSARQLAAVARGALDVAFVHDVPADSALRVLMLRQEPLGLLLPDGHPLAQRRSIAAVDLQGADWIALRTDRRELHRHQRLLAACDRHGFTPNVHFTVGDQDTMVGLVAAGMGLAFLPASLGESMPGGVVLRRLPWLKLTRATYAVTRSSSLLATTREFMACLRSVAVA